MNDQPDRKRRPWIPWAVVVTSLVATCVLIFVIYAKWWAGWERLSDFEVLCNTEDAIRAYVQKNHKWPPDWESLRSSLAEVGGDLSFARERVEVNFAVDLKSERHDDDWYVRLKAGNIPGEEQNANDRLRKSVAFYSEVRRRTTTGPSKN
jgi:hypothetical protein